MEKEMESDNYYKKCLNVLVEQLLDMKISLPKVVDPRSFGMHSKIHFKAHLFRELCFMRIYDISNTAFELYENKRIIPALILTRAQLETLASFYFFYTKTSRVVNKEIDMKEYIEKLDRLLLGSKIEKDIRIDPINVLTCIEKMDKENNGFKEQYDFLSEYCHPNEQGMLLSYSSLNKDKFRSELNISNLVDKYPHMNGIVTLSFNLRICFELYEKTADLIEPLSTLTEEYFAKKE